MGLPIATKNFIGDGGFVFFMVKIFPLMYD